jgi:hypothetical protein
VAYPRAPLDYRDDIVELDFADTSTLSDIDAFEYRWHRNSAKHSKRDGAMEREEIERSWDVLGKGITSNFGPGSSHAPEILGRLPQLQGCCDIRWRCPWVCGRPRLPRSRNRALDQL